MSINLIVIRSNQIKSLANFYELLGIQFEYHKHGNGVYHYAAIVNETVFEIYPLLKNQEKADKSLRLGFEVDELDCLIKKLQINSIQIQQYPTLSEFGYIAIIKDLDGRKIELKQIIK